MSRYSDSWLSIKPSKVSWLGLGQSNQGSEFGVELRIRSRSQAKGKSQKLSQRLGQWSGTRQESGTVRKTGTRNKGGKQDPWTSQESGAHDSEEKEGSNAAASQQFTQSCKRLSVPLFHQGFYLNSIRGLSVPPFGPQRKLPWYGFRFNGLYTQSVGIKLQDENKEALINWETSGSMFETCGLMTKKGCFMETVGWVAVKGIFPLVSRIPPRWFFLICIVLS